MSQNKNETTQIATLTAKEQAHKDAGHNWPIEETELRAAHARWKAQGGWNAGPSTDDVPPSVY